MQLGLNAAATAAAACFIVMSCAAANTRTLRGADERIWYHRAASSENERAVRDVAGARNVDPESWITPAPDYALRESVALAFVTLLQGLPARQRAALLLKDVVGFSTDEIAQALEMSTSAVSSALQRARDAMVASAPTNDPARRGGSESDFFVFENDDDAPQWPR